ncbi:MAG: CYTH domain-containing protein [Gammaproteobacteria bacterium]|nr:CYTH domain-containing protein [Gammaproteobacteria bacterium]
MGIEIERKYLLKSDGWRKDIDRSQIYRQGYLKQDGKCTVRVRIGGKQAHLNIKGASKSISRAEYEYEIPMQEAGEMLDNLCVGSVIEKTRHLVKHGSHIWEIDVFQGDNAGLIVAEIELSAEDESFERPAWLGEEVSEDPRYLNASLVTKPFCSWDSE